MYPDLFGIPNFSYTLCLIVGFVAAFLCAFFYLKKKGITKAGIIDLAICACFAIAGGIVFAILFENLYELIEKGKDYEWTWAMTFLGGLIGGVFAFILTYNLMIKNVNFKIIEVAKVAPISITIAHAIGRVGCFLAGCCYGKETDSWIGVTFPNLGKRVPTQLIESIFLFILFGVLLFLTIKFDFKYNFVVYCASYGLFRFIIEFYRDDPRGVAFFLSPSQVLCIILMIISVPLYFYLKNIMRVKNVQE